MKSIEQIIMCVGEASTFKERLIKALQDHFADIFNGKVNNPEIKEIWDSIKFRIEGDLE